MTAYALNPDIGSFRGHPESGHTPEPSDHEMRAVSGPKAVVTRYATTFYVVAVTLCRSQAISCRRSSEFLFDIMMSSGRFDGT